MKTTDKHLEEEEEARREAAIILYQKRDEVEQTWREYEELSQREPAKIIVSTPVKDEVQDNSLPF